MGGKELFSLFSIKLVSSSSPDGLPTEQIGMGDDLQLITDCGLATDDNDLALVNDAVKDGSVSSTFMNFYDCSEKLLA